MRQVAWARYRKNNRVRVRVRVRGRVRIRVRSVVVQHLAAAGAAATPSSTLDGIARSILSSAQGADCAPSAARGAELGRWPRPAECLSEVPGALSATSGEVELQNGASFRPDWATAYLPGWGHSVIRQTEDRSLALSLAPLTDPQNAVSQSGARTSLFIHIKSRPPKKILGAAREAVRLRHCAVLYSGKHV